MKLRTGDFLVLVAVMVCLFPFAIPACGETPGTEVGKWTIGGRFSEEVQEFLVDGLIPMWSPGKRVLFLNVRGSFLEDLEQEGNFGLVFRSLLPERSVIVGANAYYDVRRTDASHNFEQVGGGVELLSRWFDVRGNYYHPLTDERVLSEREETITTVGGGRRTTRSVLLRSYEEALEGWDAEVGVWVPGLSKFVPTGVFAGYYDFSSDFEDDVSGVRARLESRLHQNLTFDVEWFEDKDLNRTRYFVGARLHFPLDFWRGVKFGRGGNAQAEQVRPFNARISDTVYRDFRIRTIQTGEIRVDETISSTRISSRSPAFVGPPPAPEPPPVTPPNCYLNSDGEVICE